MKIYRLESDSDDDGNSPYETLCLGTGGASFDFDMTRKREDAARWIQNPLKGQWCGEGLPLADHPDVAVADEILSQRAVDVLRDLLDLQRGDLYPVDVRDSETPYWIYRIWERVNVLNMPIPDVRVGHVRNPVFLPNVTPPVIFKNMHESGLWVTHGFVDRVISAGLTGFAFEYVGDTDPDATCP